VGYVCPAPRRPPSAGGAVYVSDASQCAARLFRLASYALTFISFIIFFFSDICNLSLIAVLLSAKPDKITSDLDKITTDLD